MNFLEQDVRAVHYKGGNYFDDMRINISESHRRFIYLNRNIRDINRQKFRKIIKFYLTRIALRIGIYEFLIMNGINTRWLNQFQKYWTAILNGRPFWNTLEFFMLLHDYRKRQQYTSQLEWSTSKHHLDNWQHPNQIYSTLHYARKLALQPITHLSFWNRVSKGMCILEYGCSLAPYYYSYREFFTHLRCEWTLADIPNFPFHYAKYLYKDDPDVEFITINESDFSNPLGDVGEFDIIILTAVLEHLDNPLFVSEYLLKKLKTGGFFVFDFIKSDGKGLDHPKALEMRRESIKSIFSQTQVIQGNFSDINENLSRCISQKYSR